MNQIKWVPIIVFKVAAAAGSEVRNCPEFILPLYNMKVMDGQSATLECQVLGNPTPTIRWSVDETNIEASKDFKMTYEETTGRCALVIGDVLPEDEGQYKVLATNELGSNSSSAYLTVQREFARCFCVFSASWQFVHIDSSNEISKKVNLFQQGPIVKYVG